MQGLKHHELMVSQQHLHIGSAHDFSQNPDSVRISVDYITEDIECIFIFEGYLVKDGVESPCLTMDVRHNVYHMRTPSCGFCVERRLLIVSSIIGNFF